MRVGNARANKRMANTPSRMLMGGLRSALHVGLWGVDVELFWLSMAAVDVLRCSKLGMLLTKKQNVGLIRFLLGA